MMGISLSQLLVCGLVIVLLFGTNKLRSIATEFGLALHAFRKALQDGSREQKEVSDSEASNDEPNKD